MGKDGNLCCCVSWKKKCEKMFLKTPERCCISCYGMRTPEMNTPLRRRNLCDTKKEDEVKLELIRLWRGSRGQFKYTTFSAGSVSSHCELCPMSE